MPKKRKLKELEDYCAAAREAKNGENLKPEEFLQDQEFFHLDSKDYHESQTHSSCVDLILGLPVPEVEARLRQKAKELQPGGTVESWSAKLYDGVMTWVGLNPAQLQTPYEEIFELLRELDPQENDSIIDLGAGYGRMGLVIGQLFPKVKFVGYEMAQERVEAGNLWYKRFKMDNALLKQQNIASDNFALPPSKFYFIYDFGSLPDMKKLLAKLDALADQKSSFIVVARGRGINSLIQETAPWLTVNSSALGNSNIYRHL